MEPSQLDQVLEKLAKDVEASIHAFYRGDVRQHTQRVKTDTFIREARQALTPLLGSAPVGGAGSSSAASAPTTGVLTPDEIVCATRCVIGWMPMGPPSAASQESRCVSAAREMTPTWGEREKARLALKRVSG